MAMNVVTLSDKIHRRSGHIAVPYKHTMLVWGGYMERVLDADLELTYSVYHYTDELWVYNCITGIWDRVLTKGDIPPKVTGCCAVLYHDDLYVFGGHQSVQESLDITGTTNQLYCLNLLTKTWTLLEPSGDQPLPCEKLVGWTYNDKLYFFGGFGPAPNTYYPFEHVLERTTEFSLWPTGWNNQLVVYNIKENCWEWPHTRGRIPTPRAAHAADITGSQVYMFGGRLQQIRNNELHCLDLNTMTWSGNLTDYERYEGKALPEGRTWHSLTFISPTRAVVYGGLSQHNAVLSDCWIMDVERDTTNVRWCKLPLLNNPPLLLHKSVFNLRSGGLFINGGLKRSILDTVTRKDHADELLILYFKPQSLYRLSLNIVCNYYKHLEPEVDSLPVNLQVVIRDKVEQQNCS